MDDLRLPWWLVTACVVTVAATVLSLIFGFFVDSAAFGVTAVVLYFAWREVLPRTLDHLDDARRNRDKVALRADQQNRWALRGDSRGVYGPEGAELMRSVAPALVSDAPAAAQETGYAGVARTQAELRKLLADKPPGWRWALFASVLVQRYAAAAPRLRDHALGYAPAGGGRVRTDRDLARFLNDRLDDIDKLGTGVQEFMLNPKFMAMFGTPEDENAADAEGIMHIANRLMDLHGRFLGVAERCRGVTAPSQYARTLAECARLVDGPLTGYREFVDAFVELVAEMPDLLHGAPPGAVDGGTIQLDVHPSSRALRTIRRKAQSLARRKS